jgi:hypothetical protein
MLAEIEDLPRQLKVGNKYGYNSYGRTAVNYKRISQAMLINSGKHQAKKLPQIQTSIAIMV